ncbi:MAG: pyrroline-5-carboxylate reductase [Clostridia bacterium]|nr:pyrroline-5-carboxylate reductase [Clostridia bacterium]
MTKYGFIGLGNMASAIIDGMKNSGQYDMRNVYGYDTVSSKANECGVCACDSIAQLCKTVDIVVLAVKPQILPKVLPEVKENALQALIVSIAAGKTIDYLAQALYENAPIVRVMPNINARVGASTVAFCANASVADEQKKLVETMLCTIGTVTELPESMFSVFTAIAGSSPAFTYIYIDALARAAVQAGMPKAQALQIAASSVFGSAKLVMESGEHPYALADSVCSPSGTTIDGVLTLQENAFESTVHKAIKAVIEKDKRL